MDALTAEGSVIFEVGLKKEVEASRKYELVGAA
jgi:hypothetical protein